MSEKRAKQKRNTIKDFYREDFRRFLFLIWKHLQLPEPTPRQYEIAYELQHGPKRLVIEGFRGIGKSWVTSAFVCWILLKNPEEKVLVVSASKSRSDDFSTFTLRLIKEVPILKHLIPKPDQRESKIAFDVAPCRAAHAPSVKSAGIFGQLSGSRATTIIADDVEVPNNSATQDAREKLLKAVSEFEAILVPEGSPRIIFLGTPQTEESVYNKLKPKGYTVRIWPVRYPDEKTLIGYGGGLAPAIQRELEKDSKLVGKPTDPQRFTEMDLLEREMSYGRSGFALQFMLDTSLSDREKYPLRTSDFIVADVGIDKAPTEFQYGSAIQQVLPFENCGFSGDRWYGPLWFNKEVWAEYEGSVMAIDPSGRGTDETGYCVINQLHGKLFLMVAGGLKGGYGDDNLIQLALIAKKYKVKGVIIESNFGDGMFLKLLTPVMAKIYKCKLEEVRHSTQKEKRIIDTLEPVLNSHRLIVHPDVIREDNKKILKDPQYSLFYQLTRITKERGALKHDDALDCLAMAVNYWNESMAKDEDKVSKQHKEKLLKIELENFMKYAIGYKQEKRGFIDW